MTAREKAFELILKVEKELIGNQVYRGTIKKLALIAVDEVIQHIEKAYYNEDIIKGAKLYWEEVKEEIKKL